jgi:S1-C subfamily serine protease
VDIPAIHFFTGAHADYHKPSDDVELINAPGMEMIADMVSKVISEIDDDQKLVFSRTKDPDPSSTPTMEVTLGVLPDYLYDGVGMRIDGVRDGKPAAVAGMQKGDVIIQFNGKDVKDIYVYMEVLGELKKGDQTTLVALRDGKEMKFDIQF